MLNSGLWIRVIHEWVTFPFIAGSELSATLDGLQYRDGGSGLDPSSARLRADWI